MLLQSLLPFIRESAPAVQLAVPAPAPVGLWASVFLICDTGTRTPTARCCLGHRGQHLLLRGGKRECGILGPSR